MARKRNKNDFRLTQEDLLVIERAARREVAKENGYYDGRNRPAVYTDRKKRANRDACRGRVGQDY
ncbi:MAG: hypothetical protein JRG69_06275 [Deltaproteobacteria bacterium]|nr:hypothetical protein [Deltaproteobacteria bacterium]